jgi:hypothetical protein
MHATSHTFYLGKVVFGRRGKNDDDQVDLMVPDSAPRGRRQQDVTFNAAFLLLFGAATLRWILQQLHSKTVLALIGVFPNNKTPFSHNNYMKSMEFYDNYMTLVCLEKTNILTISY